MKKPTNQQLQAKFYKECRKLIEEAGAELITFDKEYKHNRKYNLNTKYGNLVLNLEKRTSGNLFTLFTRFNEPEKARIEFDCGYVGTYNFNIVGDLEFMLDMIKGFLNRIKIA